MIPSGNVDWLWNNPGNYNFISGPLANITLLTGVGIYLHKHNCHVKHCARMAWHDHPDHGHPVCKKHFPQKQTPDLSAAAHRDAT
jgi:hypothetical protein